MMFAMTLHNTIWVLIVFGTIFTGIALASWVSAERERERARQIREANEREEWLRRLAKTKHVPYDQDRWGA